MDSIDEDKEECNYVFSDVETISFADWYRDQSKDDDLMNEVGDDKEVEAENGGLENRKTKKKKLGKQVIIYELNCPQNDCILSFKSLEELYQHQETVHGIMAYNCLASGCSEQYNKRIGIRRHYSTVHSGHTNWICTHCSAKLNDSNQLRRHIRELHQFGRFGCASVDCSFEADLRSKIRSHRQSAHPRLVCSFNGCGKGFYYESQLKLHYHFCHSDTAKLDESIIQTENKVGMIGKNDRSESSESDASIKVDSNEANNSKVIILGVKCSQSDCDMMLKTMSQLHQHHKSVHGILRYPCLIAGCSQQFNHGIGHHHSTAHPHPQSWVCSKCDDFKFANPHVLRCHIRDFHQYGHFQCGYSDCAFEANLRSRVRNHCTRAHARFSCPIVGCDYVAHFESWVKQHQQTVHHATTVREDSKGQNDSNQTEPTNNTSIKVDSKKRTKDVSHSKVITKRPKLIDDVDDETTNKKKPIILGLKCAQSECNLTFESFSQLRQHQKDSHSVLAFPCLVNGCSEQYNNRHKIGDHYSTVHPHHTNWTCPQCNVKKANSTLLRRHIRNYHQLGQFHCGHLVCTFEADLRSKVRMHTKNVH